MTELTIEILKELIKGQVSEQGGGAARRQAMQQQRMQRRLQGLDRLPGGYNQQEQRGSGGDDPQLLAMMKNQGTHSLNRLIGALLSPNPKAALQLIIKIEGSDLGDIDDWKAQRDRAKRLFKQIEADYQKKAKAQGSNKAYEAWAEENPPPSLLDLNKPNLAAKGEKYLARICALKNKECVFIPKLPAGRAARGSGSNRELAALEEWFSLVSRQLDIVGSPDMRELQNIAWQGLSGGRVDAAAVERLQGSILSGSPSGGSTSSAGQKKRKRVRARTSSSRQTARGGAAGATGAATGQAAAGASSSRKPPKLRFANAVASSSPSRHKLSHKGARNALGAILAYALKQGTWKQALGEAKVIEMLKNSKKARVVRLKKHGKKLLEISAGDPEMFAKIFFGDSRWKLDQHSNNLTAEQLYGDVDQLAKETKKAYPTLGKAYQKFRSIFKKAGLYK